MSKIVTIPEVIEEQNDVAILVFKAKIKSIYKRREVQGNFGAGSFEDLIVTDGQNDLKVVLKDREPIDQNLKGQTVYFLSTNGKHGWQGVKTFDDKDAQNNPRRILRITPTAEIVTAGAYEGGDQTPQQQTQTQRPANTPQTQKKPAAQPAPTNQPADKTSTTTGQPTGEQSLVMAKKFCARRLSLFKIAAKATLAFKEEFDSSEAAKHLGITLTSEEFWKIVSGLKMSMEAEGLAMRKGFADALPTNIAFKDLSIIPAKAATGQTTQAKAQPPAPKCAQCGAENVALTDGKCTPCNQPPEEDSIPF